MERDRAYCSNFGYWAIAGAALLLAAWVLVGVFPPKSVQKREVKFPLGVIIWTGRWR